MHMQLVISYILIHDRVLASSPVQNFDFRLGVSVPVSVPAFPDSSCWLQRPQRQRGAAEKESWIFLLSPRWVACHLYNLHVKEFTTTAMHRTGSVYFCAIPSSSPVQNELSLTTPNFSHSFWNFRSQIEKRKLYFTVRFGTFAPKSKRESWFATICSGTNRKTAHFPFWNLPSKSKRGR